jgi:hypothetical protein
MHGAARHRRQHRFPRLGRSLCALIAAACLLAGCGAGTGRSSLSASRSPGSTPAAAVTASASVSASITPSPTGTAPLLTGAAVKPGELPPTRDTRFAGDDANGALSFANYFYESIDWSIATSNPNLLRSISGPGCRPCQQYIHEIDAVASAGGHSEGGRSQSSSFAIVHGTLIVSDYVVKVTFSQQVQVIVAAGGASATYAPRANPGTNYLYMTWVDNQWQAVGIELG